MTSCLGRKLRITDDDADLERLGLRAREHGQRLAHHPRPHVGQRQDGRRRAGRDDGVQPHAVAPARRGDRESEREQAPTKQTQRRLRRTRLCRVGGRARGVNATPALSREKPRSAELASAATSRFRASWAVLDTAAANRQHDRAHEVAFGCLASSVPAGIGLAAGCGPQEALLSQHGRERRLPDRRRRRGGTVRHGTAATRPVGPRAASAATNSRRQRRGHDCVPRRLSASRQYQSRA